MHEMEPKKTSYACSCEEHETCRRCLGQKARLLTEVPGGDGVVDVSEGLYARHGLECSCVTGEVCRYCVAPLLQARLFALLGQPWHDAPDPLKGLLTPLDYLEHLAPAN